MNAELLLALIQHGLRYDRTRSDSRKSLAARPNVVTIHNKNQGTNPIKPKDYYLVSRIKFFQIVEKSLPRLCWQFLLALSQYAVVIYTEFFLRFPLAEFLFMRSVRCVYLIEGIAKMEVVWQAYSTS